MSSSERRASSSPSAPPPFRLDAYQADLDLLEKLNNISKTREKPHGEADGEGSKERSAASKGKRFDVLSDEDLGEPDEEQSEESGSKKKKKDKKKQKKGHGSDDPRDQTRKRKDDDDNDGDDQAGDSSKLKPMKRNFQSLT